MSCVLITGATGVIGSELVPHFLADRTFDVRLLIRARSPEHLAQRLAELAQYWEIPREDQRLKPPRLESLAGDVCATELGLDPAFYRRLAAEVTHIVHAAGNVRLDQTLEQARRNALVPAKNIVQFARLCQQHGRLEKLDVVTTIGVAGRMPGLIPERPLVEPRRFHNYYEQAKAETEQFLLEQLAAALPITIHRPSMVVGRSDTGRIFRKQVFYYLREFLTGTKTWGFLPELGDARLDIVPVDRVAQLIYRSAVTAKAIGRVFHLCAGPEGAIRLVDLVREARDLASSDGHPLPPLRFVRRRTFRLAVRVLGMVTWGRTRRVLRALPHLLAYLDTRQTFDIAQTTAFFCPQ